MTVIIHRHEISACSSSVSTSWVLLHPVKTSEPCPHLYGVVQGGAGRVQRQVLERFDLWSLPAALLRPVDGQHVVGELFAEHQGGGVRLRLACCVAFNDEICCLRCGRTSDPEAGEEKEVAGTRAEQARNTVIVFKSTLLAMHALKRQLVERYKESVEKLTYLLN